MKESSEQEQLAERIELSLLYDFYGALLKEHPKKMFAENVLEDWNLSEIAEEEGISRQGVYDSIKRATRQLYRYEETLGLVARYKKQKEQLLTLQALVKALPLSPETEPLSSIHQILEDLLREI